MRTERAPTTAFSGRNISEVSLAISTAILAAPYAVLQPDSLDEPGSLPKGSQDGEQIDNATALDEATSVLGSLTWGWIVASSLLMNSEIGDVGVGGGPVVGVTDDEDFRRK